MVIDFENYPQLRSVLHHGGHCNTETPVKPVKKLVPRQAAVHQVVNIFDNK